MGLDYIEEEKKLFNFLSKYLPKKRQITLNSEFLPDEHSSKEIEINYSDSQLLWFIRIPINNEETYYYFGLKNPVTDVNNDIFLRLLSKVNENNDLSFFKFVSGQLGIEIKFKKGMARDTFYFLEKHFTLKQPKNDRSKYYIMLGELYTYQIIETLEKLMNHVEFHLDINKDYLVITSYSEINDKLNFPKLNILESDNFNNNINQNPQVIFHENKIKLKQLIKDYVAFIDLLESRIENLGEENSNELTPILQNLRMELNQLYNINNVFLNERNNVSNHIKLYSKSLNKSKEEYDSIELDFNKINNELDVSSVFDVDLDENKKELLVQLDEYKNDEFFIFSLESNKIPISQKDNVVGFLEKCILEGRINDDLELVADDFIEIYAKQIKSDNLSQIVDDLNNSTFIIELQQKYPNFDETDIEDIKNRILNDQYSQNLNQSEIKNKFKLFYQKKNEELNYLKELNHIRRYDLYVFKYAFLDSEIEMIYDDVKNIINQWEVDDSVESVIQVQAKYKADSIRSRARKKLEQFTLKEKSFNDLLHKYGYEVSDSSKIISNIEFKIEKIELRSENITYEYLERFLQNFEKDLE